MQIMQLFWSMLLAILLHNYTLYETSVCGCVRSVFT